MTEIDTIMPRAFAVLWKEMHRWGVSYFKSGRWYWPPSILKRVADFTNPEALPITVHEAQEQNIPIISKINFGGELFLRNSDDYADYKGRLFLVKSNRFIFSKINAKRGCIYFAPENQKPFAVSSEYPVLKLDTNKVLGDYFNLAMRVGPAREGLVSFAAGMAKARTNLEDFLSIEIPLPPLAEQKTIVACWRNAQNDIASAKDRIAAISLELENGLLKQIGLEIELPTPQRGAFTLLWGDLERWDTFFYRKDFVALKHSLARISRKKLGNLVSFISRPWKRESFPDGFFKYVEISSVSKEDGIFSSKVIAIKKAPSRATTLICKGDLIISTTRPYLGAIAIVPEAYDNHVCSSAFSLVDSVDDTHILKEYLLFFLKSQGGLKQMEQRMTGGLYPAITQDELEKIEIPLPSLGVQKQIIERVTAGREEITREREVANRLIRDITAEVEALILGTKKVSEL